MNKNFGSILIYLLLSSCLVQNQYNETDFLLNDIYIDQLEIYNKIKIADKENYSSIIDFGKRERFKVFKQIKQVTKSESFYILEGFKPGWGEFIGLAWNNKVAFSYRRSSISSKLKITKTNINVKDLKKDIGIDKFVIDKITDWDINYINSLNGEIGVSVSDGFYFIATKVVATMHQSKKHKIETIAFEEFKK